MNEQSMESVVAKSVIIERPIEDAFRIWTEEINRWWPRSHSLSRDPQTQVIIECSVGGRFYERTSEGIEHDWGKVFIWEPPTHFAYLWYLGSGLQLPTRVDVNFVAMSENRTRVDILHRGPELIGELWSTNKGRYSMSWDSVLPEFVQLCQSSSAA